MNVYVHAHTHRVFLTPTAYKNDLMIYAGKYNRAEPVTDGDDETPEVIGLRLRVETSNAKFAMLEVTIDGRHMRALPERNLWLHVGRK